MNEYQYVVTVKTETRANADQVMAERLGYSENYGFDYEVDWTEMFTPTREALADAVRAGCTVASYMTDPALAVSTVIEALPKNLKDNVRVSVSRPSVVGKTAVIEATAFGITVREEARVER